MSHNTLRCCCEFRDSLGYLYCSISLFNLCCEGVRSFAPLLSFLSSLLSFFPLVCLIGARISWKILKPVTQVFDLVTVGDAQWRQ